MDNVEEEFNDIKAACERARLVTNPWRTILKPSYAPQLFIAITATLFQQVPSPWHVCADMRRRRRLLPCTQINLQQNPFIGCMAAGCSACVALMYL